MYQKMFNEEGNHYIGLIMSPYYTTTDAAPRFNGLPKLRCFITVKIPNSSTILPFELPINIMPCMKLYKEPFIEQVKSLKNNVYAVDFIKLDKETTIIRGPKI